MCFSFASHANGLVSAIETTILLTDHSVAHNKFAITVRLVRYKSAVIRAPPLPGNGTRWWFFWRPNVTRGGLAVCPFSPVARSFAVLHLKSGRRQCRTVGCALRTIANYESSSTVPNAPCRLMHFDRVQFALCAKRITL